MCRDIPGFKKRNENNNNQVPKQYRSNNIRVFTEQFLDAYIYTNMAYVIYTNMCMLVMAYFVEIVAFFPKKFDYLNDRFGGSLVCYNMGRHI